MLSASAHKLYCKDIQGKAQEELIQLQARRADIERIMQENAGFEEEEQRKQQAQMQAETQSTQDHLKDDNDRAKDLEDKAKKIDLGKNLEQRADKKIPKQKEAKDKATTRSRPNASEGVDISNAVSDQGQEESLDLAVSSAAPSERGKMDKKGKRDRSLKKDKKGKKDKKKHKKHRKRELDEEEPGEEGECLAEDESPGMSDDGLGLGADDGTGIHSEKISKKEKKDKKKHDKKHKKDRKHKKARHHSKREGEDSNDEVDDGAGLMAMEDDAAMEEELFGPEGDI